MKKLFLKLTQNGGLAPPTLEQRIFNFTCLMSILLCVFDLLFNFIVGNLFGTYLSAFGIFFSAAMYYLSFYKQKTVLAIKILFLTGNIAFGINYFYSSGISGPSYLFFAAIFLMTVALVSEKKLKQWISFNVLIFLLVVTLEYLYPQSVVQIFGTLNSKLINFTVTYLILVTIIYFSFVAIKKNYEIERYAVIEKSKAIEEQKLQLEKLNAEKNKLFSIVSHDLRHPLNSIQSYLELLMDDDLTAEERLTFNKQLLSITKNTSQMLSNILFWARSQMQEGCAVVMEPLILKNILEDCLTVEKNIALKKKIKLKVEVADDIVMLADKNMFQVVIRNLVSNAIKFTPAEGSVLIDADQKDNKCYITVKDTGLGIDLEQQQTLFKLKASSTFGTNNEKGIGLGLLLCKEFTDLQGGTISFESSKTTGSSFFLAFKLAV